MSRPAYFDKYETGGDRLHVAWEKVAGTARAKWLLGTGEEIKARTAAVVRGQRRRLI
jgi:hypothetical protein